MIDNGYEKVLQRQVLHDMLISGEVRPLEDVFLIEDTALKIQSLNKKIEFYKEYKKNRVQAINDEIKVVQNKIDFYTEVIIATLRENKEKSIDFPGSCSVRSRNQKPKWEIKDDEAFINILRTVQENGEPVDNILKEVVTYSIRKREADKLLDKWEGSGRIKEEIEDIVSKIPSKTTIALSFEEKDEDVKDDFEDLTIPVKKGSQEDNEQEHREGMDEFDEL